MKPLALSSVLFVSAAALSGCLGSVIVDDRGRDANGNLDQHPSSGSPTEEATDTNPEPTSPAEQGPNALVVRYGDLSGGTDDGASGGSSSSSSTSAGVSTSGGDTTDPNQLLIVLSNRGITCSNPFGYGDSCLTTQRLYIPLPVDLQHPGLIDLAQVNAYFSEFDGNPDPAICWNGGGGGSVEGTLDIESIDESGVRGQLAVISPTFDRSYIYDIAPYGALWAARCAAE